MLHIAYIGLGSNLGDSAETVVSAMRELRQLPESEWIAGSSLWGSKPLANRVQPDYVNAVCSLKTTLSPLALLDAMQSIENYFGRTRGSHWAARTLDLDLLLFDDLVLETERLVIPHPGLSLREFVLLPLLELEPNMCVPGLGKLADLLSQCESLGIRKLASRAGS